MKRIKGSLILCIAFAVVLLCAPLLCGCSGEKAEESNGAFDYKAVRPEYQEDIESHRLQGYLSGNFLDNSVRADPNTCKHYASGYVINKDTHFRKCRSCLSITQQESPHGDMRIYSIYRLAQFKVYVKRCSVCGTSQPYDIFDGSAAEAVLTIKDTEEYNE